MVVQARATALRLLSGCTILLAITLAAGARAAVVTSNQDSGNGTLRDAVANAQSGETITFAITGTIGLGSEIEIDDDLTIAGPGPSLLTIVGNRVFRIDSGAKVDISGVSLTASLGAMQAATPGSNGSDGNNGSDGAGGAILNVGDLALSNCAVNGAVGGGVGGDAGFGGPGVPGGNGGNGGIGGGARGGAIYNAGSLSITDCAVTGLAQGGGGGDGNKGGNGIPNPDLLGVGGGGGNGGNGGLGGPAEGGAIYTVGALNVLRCTIEGAATAGSGGAAGAGGDGQGAENQGGKGGNGGRGGNGGFAEGAGIFAIEGATVDIRDSAIVHSTNTAGDGGAGGAGGLGGGSAVAGGDGGIGGAGGAGGFADGAGIFLGDGILTALNSTFSDNLVFAGKGAKGGDGGDGGDAGDNAVAGGAAGGGAGAGVSTPGDGGPGGAGGGGGASAGGAIFALTPATLTHVTVAEGNTFQGTVGAGGTGGSVGFGQSRAPDGPAGPEAVAVGGAGIFLTSGGMVDRTLLAKNNGMNCAGTFTSGGFNLSDDASCAARFTQPTDLPPNTDAMIEALALNPPGHTPTHALEITSPAVDAIPDPSCVVDHDQRGVARPQRSGCDIGAYELTDIEPTPALGREGLLLLAGLMMSAGMLRLRRRSARVS